MADSSSSVCAICYRTLCDARLLGCLHSFCKTCLDDLYLRSGNGDKISCPLCRSKTRWPETGASGLPKDTTVEEVLTCTKCEKDGQDIKPELWCSACDVAFCKDHGIGHLLTSKDHSVRSFACGNSGETASRVSGSSRRCEEHDRRLEYFC